MGTIEGNKLIAKFMELVCVIKFRHSETGRLVNYSSKLESDYFIDSSEPIFVYKNSNNSLPELKYHISWDWLIPVIDKITDLDEYEIYANDGFSIYSPNNLINTKYIRVIWNNVIYFLEWYNKRNNN